MVTVGNSTLGNSNRLQNSTSLVILSALKTYFPLVVSRLTRNDPVVVFWLVTKSCILVITVFVPTAVTAMSKPWVCSLSLTGIAASNPTESVDGCQL